MKTVAFYTLGCKLNFAETSTISRQLLERGFSKVDFTQAADLYVINTCSVTDHADKKCKKVVNEALRFNSSAYIVVVGCYAQLKPEEIASIPGVDMVLGAAEKFNLIENLHSLVKEEKPVVKNAPIKETTSFIAGFSEGDRTRTFFKVQDGCDYFCTFCTIPLARGSSRSASVLETVSKVKQAVQGKGIKEVVLTGVNLGDFGVNNNETFFNLIQELDEIEGVDRYRISSIEPNLLSSEIIQFVSHSKKFMPHFHIPLQSGSDTILAKMRRKYNLELYTQRLQEIKRTMPHCAIGIDIIVGFPGETEEEFLATYQYLNESEASYLHVFPYSERANTTANKMREKVPVKERMRRSEMLRILSEKKRRSFYHTQIGKTATVLFEDEEKRGFMFGFTENYVKVKMEYDPLLVNELVQVEMTNIDEDGFMKASIPVYAVH